MCINYGDIINVQPVLQEYWPFTLRIFTYFRLSSQLLLHCCTIYTKLGRSVEKKPRFACGEIIHVGLLVGRGLTSHFSYTVKDNSCTANFAGFIALDT